MKKQEKRKFGYLMVLSSMMLSCVAYGVYLVELNPIK